MGAEPAEDAEGEPALGEDAEQEPEQLEQVLALAQVPPPNRRRRLGAEAVAGEAVAPRVPPACRRK